MSIAYSLAALASSLALPAQATDAPATPSPTQNPFRIGKMAWRDIAFVPPRWKLYDKVTGDLDGNGLTDSVLVVQKNDPAKMMSNPDRLGMDYYDANARTVLVLLQKNAGEYHLVATDSAIIPDHDSPTISDPYEFMSIDKGSLHLHILSFANAGSWSTSSHRFQFRWDGDAMELIGFERSYVHRASGEMRQTSVNYLTKRRKDAQGNIEDDEMEWRWSDLPKATSHALGSIGNGFDFEG